MLSVNVFVSVIRFILDILNAEHSWIGQLPLDDFYMNDSGYKGLNRF